MGNPSLRLSEVLSLRQTISSRSLASTLNLTCANDVTCSYDVNMRKRQVLNLMLTLRARRFSLHPKQFDLCQKCSNIQLQGLSWTKVDPSIVVSLNYSRPTLNLLKVREEFYHQGLQTTKAQTSLRIDLRSLISAFAIHKLNSIVFKLAPSETLLFLSSLCGRQVLSHRCSYMHLYSCICGPNPQTCFM